jgi:transcriptional regulator NrdR family protein
MMERSGSFSCPKCGKKTGVVDSRPNETNDAVRRRRKCLGCHYRFTTYESEIARDADYLDVTSLAELHSTLEKAAERLQRHLSAAAAFEELTRGRHGAKP